MEQNGRESRTAEARDWSAFGKDSFTTPGGAGRYPSAPGSRIYSYDRSPTARVPLSPRPAAAASPFSREAASGQPWDLEAPRDYAAPVGLTGSPAAETTQAAIAAQAAAAAQAAVTVQSASAGAPQVYTIQLPAQNRAPAPKQRSLWWLPLLLIVTLLLGVLLGVICYPLFAEPGGTPSTPSEPSEDAETAAARIYRENVDTVARILAIPVDDPASSYYQPPSAGTGFVISSDGYLLTSAHVVMGAGEIRAEFSDGKQYRAVLIGIEQQRSDIALLKIEATGLHPVSIGDAESLQVGDRVCTIGNPMGDLSFSLTTGYLSAGPREIDTGGTRLTMLQTNAAINKGNSGGPLFDSAGRVVGVVTAKYAASESDASVEGLGFALPINSVMELVDAWLAAASALDYSASAIP